jgi:uncharacterized membrane protein
MYWSPYFPTVEPVVYICIWLQSLKPFTTKDFILLRIKLDFWFVLKNKGTGQLVGLNKSFNRLRNGRSVRST